MWAESKGFGHLHSNTLFASRLQTIVLRDPDASVRNEQSFVPASPEALFESLTLTLAQTKKVLTDLFRCSRASSS